MTTTSHGKPARTMRMGYPAGRSTRRLIDESPRKGKHRARTRKRTPFHREEGAGRAELEARSGPAAEIAERHGA